MEWFALLIDQNMQALALLNIKRGHKIFTVLKVFIVYFWLSQKPRIGNKFECNQRILAMFFMRFSSKKSFGS